MSAPRPPAGRRPVCRPTARRVLCVLPLVAAGCASVWTVDAPPAHADGHWGWPLPPPQTVVSGFQPPAHDWLPGHRGVDLAGRPDQPVQAAGPGIVAYAGRIGSVSVVSIRHMGGLETTYQPVRAVVREGVRVSAGTVIGRLLPAGSHCLPRACLHWGLRRGDDYLDPLALVGQTRVRLLPLLSGAGRGAWLAPAVSGASVGSSAVVVGWALTSARRRRRPLPPDVTSLEAARRRRRSVG
jgi:murein DD-endopeptidase MepM/ murein hydrolase activator NlpD